MSSALVSKKMGKLKTKILLEMINDIIIEYPNTNYFDCILLSCHLRVSK